jgi:hypothetical protein
MPFLAVAVPLFRHLFNIGLGKVFDFDPIGSQLNQRRQIVDVVVCPFPQVMRLVISEP